MKYVPILFSTPMVKAILDGSKEQTRRIIKPQPDISWMESCKKLSQDLRMFDGKGKQLYWIDGPVKEILPKIKPMDILWVRETWQHTKILSLNPEDENYGFVYRADGQPWKDLEGWTWKPSIFMPKEACRIFLEVTDVRVERLHDISEDDAVKEGIQVLYKNDNATIVDYMNYSAKKKELINDPWTIVADDARDSFFTLWESINGKYSLDSNPWVWVYSFKKIDRPDNFLK